MFLICCGWCLFSIRTTLLSLCCSHPEEEPSEPFVNASVGEKQTGSLKVKKLYLLVNPYGGGGKAKELMKEALAVWDKAKIEYTIIETERAGHAIELAYSLDLKGYDALWYISLIHLFFRLDRKSKV